MEFGLVALWIATFLVLGLVALPVTTWLFRGDEYAGLALPLALAVLTVVGHLAGHVAFGWPALLAGLVVLLAGSVLARRRVDVDWRASVEPAVVFVAGFALIVLIRGFDPAAAPLPLAIGEKFLDFGLLASLERAPALPPEDMWFAGETVRYHYGGHLATSLLATLTATAPRYAYNLGLAGFYATLVATAYSLAAAITARYDTSARSAGVLGAFFVGIAGNLSTPARVVAWLLPDAIARPLAGLVGLDPSAAAWTPADFFYFDASRVLPIDPSAAETAMSATEFPLFAWINGDLHGHMMSQPFVLLAAGLLLAYWRSGDDTGHRAVVLLGALPPVAGLVGIVNLWSFPTIWGLTAVTVALAPVDPARFVTDYLGGADWLGPRDRWALEELRRVVLGAVLATLVLLLGVVWTAPFWFLVVAGGPMKSVQWWAPWTPLGSLLVVHGVFLLAIVPAFALRASETSRTPLRNLALLGALVLAAIGFGVPALGLFGPLILGGWWLARTRDDVGFEALLVVAAAGLVVLVELVTLEGERFNVIFKPYVDLWLFFAVAAAVVLARLVDGWPGGGDLIDRRHASTLGRALVVFLVVTSGTYAVIGIPSHVESGSVTSRAEGPTLDATAYLEHQYPREAPAIRWLQNRSGRPTIVTAVPAGYWWDYEREAGASAPASLTGLPTVLGWFHEAQYRNETVYRERLDDVGTIYTGSAERQAALLREYEVRYVYVGPVERAKYDSITVSQLDGVSVAREWDGVTVYRVDRSALAA